MGTTTPKIEPWKTFEIRTGHVCYGELHNIHRGASSRKLPGFPALGRRITGGTVRRNELDFNIPALKGSWYVYPLVKESTVDALTSTVAYFVAHSTVDPLAEVTKILRISGSPYEPDSGSSSNNEITASSGIFVINRYDWGYHDARGKEEIQEPELPVELLPFAALGLVDYDQAKDFAQRLKSDPEDERELVAENYRGIWLHIKQSEYSFGRFGFNDERTHAQSFLFFTTNTDFTATRFVGPCQQTLRNFETAEMRFVRRLQEGFDFSQRHLVEGLYADSRPLQADLLGPYPVDEHPLRRVDLDAIRSHMAPTDLYITDDVALQGLENWWFCTVHLVNEVILSYFEHRIVLYLRNNPYDDPNEIACSLHPVEGRLHLLTHDLQQDLFGAGQNASSSYHASINLRLHNFLKRHGLTLGNDSLNSLCRTVATMATEIIEAAIQTSLDSQRYGYIVPLDVFQGIVQNKHQYGDGLKKSWKLWHG